MQTPAYSRVVRVGCVCGKSLACTCLAISSSWTAWRSDSNFSACARRSFRAEKRKQIPVHIFEASGDRAPRLRLWGVMKANTTPAPFLEFCEDILRQENDRSGP